MGSEKVTPTNELTKEALIQSMEAHTHNQPYLTSTKKHVAGSSSSSSSSSSSMEDLIIIAFKGLFQVTNLYSDDLFGETDVDEDLFPALRRVGEGLLAKVNKGVLQEFQHLLNNSGFKSEVEKVEKEGKQILFTGHSTGGALASLATLWVLDVYKRKHQKKFSIGCITFGSPLIGDGNLTHAVRREKWADHFTHFVMEHDIVPRIMLATKTSIQEHLPTILNFFQQKVNTTTHKTQKFPRLFSRKTPERTIDPGQLVDAEQAVAFFENVMINASTVASHDAFDLMEPTNTLKEKLSVDFVKVSPYRPFGNYVFCTQGQETPRQQLVVENPNAILQLLFYFLQLPNEDQDLAVFAINSLNEHLSYEEELNKNGFQLENRFNLKDLNEDLFTSNGTTGDTVRAKNKSLSELAASAKCCLLAGEEAEKRKKANEDTIKKSMKNYSLKKPIEKAKPEHKNKIIEDILEEIREYKKKFRYGNTDYYEAFKLQNNKDDFVANVNRLEQAKIWDVVVEMVMRKDLPDGFEGEEEVVNLGTQFRRLVEPLDIANYYRHLKGDGYIGLRPKRYKFTQRWCEHANVTRFELISESNFVAVVEELKKEVEQPKNKTVEKIKEELKNLEEQIQKWKSDEKTAADNDVFWGESILSELKEKLQ